MGFEGIVDRIADLNQNNPTYNDSRSQGDDHLRTIKNTLKEQFSGIDGESPAIAVTALARELNALSGYDTAVSVNERFIVAGDQLYQQHQRIENLEFWVGRLATMICANHPSEGDCNPPAPTPPNPNVPTWPYA